MKTVFFDLETTGAEKDKCRIIQLAIKCIDEEGKVLINKSKLYNPGVPITAAATEAHGLKDEDVKDCPSFYDDCKKLKKIFEDSVLIGYNIIVFDIPVLLYEFDRAGVALNLSRSVIDVMKLETQLSPRTLGAVYERYTGKKLDGAHDAMNDVLGTETVLAYQQAKISKDNLDEAELFQKAGVSADSADFFGKLYYNENKELCFNFGKHKGLTVLQDKDTKQYADWIIGQAFPSQVKELLKEELKKETKKAFTHTNPIKKQGFFPIAEQPNDDLPF